MRPYVPRSRACSNFSANAIPFCYQERFFSIYVAADSAESDALHLGQCGTAPRLKRPPHSQGRMYGSIAEQISS